MSGAADPAGPGSQRTGNRTFVKLLTMVGLGNLPALAAGVADPGYSFTGEKGQKY